MPVASPLVLCLDGATTVCSTALLRPDAERFERWEVVARRSARDGQGQAKVLLRQVDEMLSELDLGPEALGAIVVGTGPGTFTGVRITVATARALAFALRRPVLGVSTLAALTASALLEGWRTRLVVPIVDARRGQVFYGFYEREGDTLRGDCVWVRKQPFSVCDREDLSHRISARYADRAKGAEEEGPAILVVGESASLAPDLPPGMHMATAGVSAETLLIGQCYLKEPEGVLGGDVLGPWLEARLAAEAGFASAFGARSVGASGTPEAVKPLYVRAPDADIHITKMKDPWASSGTGAV